MIIEGHPPLEAYRGIDPRVWAVEPVGWGGKVWKREQWRAVPAEGQDVLGPMSDAYPVVPRT